MQNNWCPYGRGETQRLTGVRTEVESGERLMQAKKCKGLTATTRSYREAWKESPLRFQRVYGPANTLILHF